MVGNNTPIFFVRDPFLVRPRLSLSLEHDLLTLGLSFCRLVSNVHSFAKA